MCRSINRAASFSHSLSLRPVALFMPINISTKGSHFLFFFTTWGRRRRKQGTWNPHTHTKTGCYCSSEMGSRQVPWLEVGQHFICILSPEPPFFFFFFLMFLLLSCVVGYIFYIPFQLISPPPCSPEYDACLPSSPRISQAHPSINFQRATKRARKTRGDDMLRNETHTDKKKLNFLLLLSFMETIRRWTDIYGIVGGEKKIKK